MDERIKVYLNNISDMLYSDPEFVKLNKSIEDGKNSFRIVQRRSQKTIDMTWVLIIEEVIPNLDTIIRNPRRFIVNDEEVIDVSLAKRVGTESVKHLATHTQNIQGVEGNEIIPSRILNVMKEDTIDIYENRFIMTLLNKLGEFVHVRFEAIKNAIVNEDKVQVMLESLYKIDGMQLLFKLDSIANMTFDDAVNLKKDELNEFERVARIQSIINGFRNSPFARDMRKCIPVRNPLAKTNVLKNDFNFKAAVKLWDFILAYDEPGYSINYIDEATPISKEISDGCKGLIYLNHMVVKNLLNDEEIKQSLGYTNVKVNEDTPFDPKTIHKFICVGRLEVFILRKKKELREYASKMVSDITERMSNLKNSATLNALKVLEGYFFTKYYNNLDKKYRKELAHEVSKVLPNEYEGFTLSMVKDAYNDRLTQLLMDTFREIKDITFVGKCDEEDN